MTFKYGDFSVTCDMSSINISVKRGCWVHHVHGFRILADFHIYEAHGVPCEVESLVQSDADILFRKVRAADLPSPTRGQWITKNSCGISVASGEYGTLVRSYCGSNVLIPAANLTKDAQPILISRGRAISTTRFNHTILHAFVPQIMALRGEFVLHTTSVVIDGHCFLFAGDSGMGKSTLAGGFARLGYTIYSEDIAKIDFNSRALPHAYPSYPGVRLRGNSFLLPEDKRTNAQGRFGLPKFRVNIATSVSSEPALPVKAIFFLRRGRTVGPRFHRITPMQAIKLYLKSSFLQAFPNKTRSRIAFAQSIKFASSIPAFELSYLRSAEHFSPLLDALVKYAQALAAEGQRDDLV